MAGYDEVRAMALAMPGAVEMDHHGFPSFRIAGKIFCTLRRDPKRLMVKLDPEDQRNLCEAHPAVIDPVPGYWGRKGATFVDYGAADGPLLAMLLNMAWSGVAPKSAKRARPSA